MSRASQVRSWRWFAVLAGLAAVALLSPAWAGGNGKEQDGEGKHANLTALWWQWILEAPTIDVDGNNTNPVFDTTGEYATYGQEDGQGPGNKYFFLCGTFGFPVERTVTVPAGKTIFFPVVNWEWDNAFDPPTDNSVPELRAIIDELADAVDMDDLIATLDGEPLEIFRTKSPTFGYSPPDEDSLYDYFGLVGEQFEGTIQPTVADGYWCSVGPLEPGEYVLYFGTGDGFQDNTYYLTVE
jgi:hypothetical protein